MGGLEAARRQRGGGRAAVCGGCVLQLPAAAAAQHRLGTCRLMLSHTDIWRLWLVVVTAVCKLLRVVRMDDGLSPYGTHSDFQWDPGLQNRRTTCGKGV